MIDDLDTILSDQKLAEFLLYELRGTGSKVIFTSRQRVPGVVDIEVPPLSDIDLHDFVSAYGQHFGADLDSCLGRIEAIRSVTGAYPLFVHDLVRYSAVDGIDRALETWSQRKGDAARVYALRRQLENLGGVVPDVLMSIAVANRPLHIVEISSIAGVTDDDAFQSVQSLLQWRLISHTIGDDSDTRFSLNTNTRRLVQQTYRRDARMPGKVAAFKGLTGERVPEARRKAIAWIIRQAKELSFSNEMDAAAQHVRDSMTGELADSADLYGFLGWIYSRPHGFRPDEARSAFQNADRLGARRTETYYHWAQLERRVAEDMIDRVADSLLREQWQEFGRVAERGVEKCGDSDGLCYAAGYAYGRQAKTLDRIHEFTSAQSCYGMAISWLKRALDAPTLDENLTTKSAIYRGLALGYEGTGEVQLLADVLRTWRDIASGEYTFKNEVLRLSGKFSELRVLLPWVYFDT